MNILGKITSIVAPAPGGGGSGGSGGHGDHHQGSDHQPSLSLSSLSRPPPLHSSGFPEQRIVELNLPVSSVAPAAVANYRPVVITGNLAYVSGQIARDETGGVITGRMQTESDVAAGVAGARACAIATLSALKGTLGDLNRVVRLVKASVFVNSSSDFTAHPKVADGFSDVMVEVFGESGKGARAAVGAILPLQSVVEVESIWEVS